MRASHPIGTPGTGEPPQFAPEHLKSRFLAGLRKPERDLVMAAASRQRYFADCVVVNQGDRADKLFLLTTGRARYFYITEKGRKVLLKWLVPGDVFGAMALLRTPSRYLASTEMLKDSWVLMWHHVTIRRLVQEYPRLMDNALGIAATDYLGWYRAAHEALVSHTAQQRLASVLGSLAEVIGHGVVGGVALDVTNEELANAAHITPFTASRLLNEWERNGAVAKRRGRLLLRFPNQFLSRTA